MASSWFFFSTHPQSRYKQQTIDVVQEGTLPLIAIITTNRTPFYGGNIEKRSCYVHIKYVTTLTYTHILLENHFIDTCHYHMPQPTKQYNWYISASNSEVNKMLHQIQNSTYWALCDVSPRSHMVYIATTDRLIRTPHTNHNIVTLLKRPKRSTAQAQRRD